MLNLRQEFQLKNFKFSYKPVKDFVVSPWFPVPVLICYRAIFALYSITWIIYQLAAPSSSFRELKTLFYITNWGYFALIVYFTMSFTITTLHYIKRRQGREHTLIIDNEDDDEQDQVKYDETKCFHKVLWLFYNIAANMAIAVTLYFWALDYNGKGVTLSDLNVHILNSVFIILDHTLSSMPWRLFHVVYSILYALLYTIATVLYWVWVDKTPIYAILDYSKNPGLAAGLEIGGMLILLPLIQLFLYLVYRLRTFLEDKWVKEEVD